LSVTFYSPFDSNLFLFEGHLKGEEECTKVNGSSCDARGRHLRIRRLKTWRRTVGAMVSLQEQENNKTFIYKTVLSDKIIPFLSLI